jgi:hypothetical protein
MILQIDKMVSISGLSTPVGCCGRTCTVKNWSSMVPIRSLQSIDIPIQADTLLQIIAA